ncbi:MAG: peptidoglycan-binding protein [Aureispira sp.]
MAVSKAAIERLERLKSNIEAFLKLHKNPYNSSVHNEMADKLVQLNQLLGKLNFDQDNPNAVEENMAASMGGDSRSTTTTEENISTTPITNNLARSISDSVGAGGANKEEDVKTVQGWLNSHGATLAVNGQADNALTNEIKKFQRRLGQTRPDGRVDAGKNTWKGLLGEIPVGPPSTGVSSIIQGGESGAAGYNAYNRGTQGNTIVGPNGHRELTAMTLATVMANQALDKSHADYLFAVGKYQLIPSTLKEGVAALNLDTSLKFDVNTQELLFSGYLMDKKRPQISAYIKGTAGNSAFAAGLAAAQEWASIAVPEGHAKAGRSYYDGVGGNSAHITAEDFLGVLDEAKANYQQYIAQGMSDADAYKAAVSGVEDAANSSGTDSNSTDNDTETPPPTSSPEDNTSNANDNTTPTTLSITASVGDGGSNQEADVKIIQELLNQNGATLTVDGKIGPNTIAAIHAFQTSINIPPDGLISPNKNTWKGLINGSKTTSDIPTDDSNDNTDTNTPLSITASVGDGGSNQEADVKIIQELLNQKGAQLTVDGQIGPNTIAAIHAFQTSINIPPDGLISPNKNTWKGLIGSGGSVDPKANTGGDGNFDPGEPLAAGSKPSSSNFKYEEFISPRDPVREVPQQYWANLQKLMNNLEIIRSALGTSMNINSGYRSPDYNAQIGGASASKHMLAQAADISTSLPPSQVYDTIAQLIQDGKITPGGLGKYKNFTHYDVRGSYTPFQGAY